MESISSRSRTGALTALLSSEYGMQVKTVRPAKRGFYGETWDVQADEGRYFVKADFWRHHKESYQASLPAVRQMTSRGISFVPRIAETRDDRLCCPFQEGVAAVFAYAAGDLSEDVSVTQLYDCLAKVYLLDPHGMELKTEAFDIAPLLTFQDLRDRIPLPDEVGRALSQREPDLVRYAERLKTFSAACKDNQKNFHITHGDAGGNCIVNGDQLFLVDWDSVMLAPIERDAWIYLCERRQMEEVHSVLAANGIRYTLEKNRLCYYCYAFFFYYLSEYLRSMADAYDKRRKAEIARDLTAYLTDNWIYSRLAAADLIKPDRAAEG